MSHNGSGILSRSATQEGPVAMFWTSVWLWAIAFVMCTVGIAMFYQAMMADAEPQEKIKRRLILAGILVAAPADVLVFQFLPFPLALVASVLLTSLAVLHFTLVAPKKWRRSIGKRG